MTPATVPAAMTAIRYPPTPGAASTAGAVASWAKAAAGSKITPSARAITRIFRPPHEEHETAPPSSTFDIMQLIAIAPLLYRYACQRTALTCVEPISDKAAGD